jgi:hypothetical protein
VNSGFIVRWRFVQASTTPRAISVFLRRHRPAGYRRLRRGTYQGVASWAYTFPSARNRLTVRELVVWVAPTAGGGTAIGLESRVLWRPSWDRVGAAVSGARVRLGAGPARRIGRPAARRLARYIDGVGVFVPGWYSYPPGHGGHASVRFIGSAARLRVDRVGNGFASVWIGGRRAPTLTAPRLYAMLRHAYAAAG